MSGIGRRGSALAVLAGALTLAVATADAKTFNAGPMRYVTQQTNVASGGALAWDADCPAGSRVTAGGGEIAGPQGDVHITSTFPFDGPDAGALNDDAWRFQSFNDTATTKRERVYAACLRLGAGGGELEHLTELRAVGGGTTSGGMDIGCQGDRVVGGGISMPGIPEDNVVNSTHPDSLFNTSGTPDDRWVGRFTTSNGPTNLIEHAICLPAGVMKMRYTSAFKPVFGGQTKTVVARCPAKKGWHVAGGGIRGVFFRPTVTRPWDGKDKGRAPDDGWIAKAGLPNVSSDPVVAQVHAICLKR